MSILGAVLTGGRSSRFGSNKAIAMLGDRTLVAHARATIAPHCARVVQVGGVDGVPDMPAPAWARSAGSRARWIMPRAMAFAAC
ncbi:hypothetical protein GCM10020258_03900 [Sphingomonas yabuuchiae]